MMKFDMNSDGRSVYLVVFLVCAGGAFALSHFGVASHETIVSAWNSGGKDARAIGLGAIWLAAAGLAVLFSVPALSSDMICFDKEEQEVRRRRRFAMIPFFGSTVPFSRIRNLQERSHEETTTQFINGVSHVHTHRFRTVELEFQGDQKPWILCSVARGKSFAPHKTAGFIGKELGWKRSGSGGWAPAQ